MNNQVTSCQTDLGNCLLNYRLFAAVFLNGAVVMALEIVGSRILAPYLGSSIIIWTSLIGIILACLSLGYFWGGKLADKKPEPEVPSLLLLCASIMTAAIIFVQYPLLLMLSSRNIDLRLSGPFAAAVLFGIPSIIFGTITPYAVRLLMADVEHAGQTTGQLYAISTLGSLIGTFGGGFFLPAYFGTASTILILAALSLLASFSMHPTDKLWWKLIASLLIIALFFLNASFHRSLSMSGLIDTDTLYQRAMVLTKSSPDTARAFRMLITDVMGSQSMTYLDSPDELAGEYTKFYPLAFHFKQNIHSILVVGGGAYTLPKFFASHYPDMIVDVVEIDPGVTELARQYFWLKDLPNLNIMHEDARTYFRRTVKRYDAIFLDAFGSSPCVPFHLSTEKAFHELFQLLNPEGILIMNLISAIRGDEGKFFQAEYHTLSSVFPWVLTYPVHSDNEDEVQNLVLVGLKTKNAPALQSDNGEFSELLKHAWEGKVASNMPVLTDDFAPVEFYMLPAYLRWQEQLRKHQ